MCYKDVFVFFFFFPTSPSLLFEHTFFARGILKDTSCYSETFRFFLTCYNPCWKLRVHSYAKSYIETFHQNTHLMFLKLGIHWKRKKKNIKDITSTLNVTYFGHANIILFVWKFGKLWFDIVRVTRDCIHRKQEHAIFFPLLVIFYKQNSQYSH